MRRRTAVVLGVVAVLGCDNGERLAWFAHQANEQQAEQNHAMARLQTEPGNEMARARSEAHATVQQAIEVERAGREANQQRQRQLDLRQTEIDRRFDAVEEERKQMARQRHSDSQTAAALLTLGLLLIALAPLLLAAYVARVALSEPGLRAAHDEIALEALTRLLASPRAEPPLALPHALPRLPFEA